MNVRIIPKALPSLEATRLLQQTSLWGRIKRRLGWRAIALDLEADGAAAGDMLVIVKNVGGGSSVAYVPFGPESLPVDEDRGEYLAALSVELRPRLPDDCLFVRWDLPWESPYAREEDRYDCDGHWLGAPETRIRESRMNFGVRAGRLRKAKTDLLPPDTLLVDLTLEPDDLLARMRPKTRYNVRLAARRGVTVRAAGPGDVETWNALYADTARRNGMAALRGDYFSSVLATAGERSEGETITMLLAEKNGRPLAAMFLSITADRATYLYGASSSDDRNLMAPYALQWAAMSRAREAGCSSYDFFGVAPRPDPDHPMFGLYTFKSGFGGSMLHRQGSWDFAYDEKGYEAYTAFEAATTGFLA